MTRAARTVADLQTRTTSTAPSPADRLWRSVIRTEDDDACWNWTGRLTADGYGTISVRERPCPVHRVSYILAYGDIGEGMVIRHRCDNRRCVNPRHLVSGSQADNIADKVARDRQARGSRSGMAKLTETDIPVIRARVARGESPALVARDFGVSPRTIEFVAMGETWRHVA